MQEQALKVTDERKRLERLIALTPVGERRAQYEAQLAKLFGNSPTPLDSQLMSLRAQQDAVSAAWNRLFDQLDTMDQNTPEFDTLFAEWEKVDEQYKRLCDQIDLLELSAHIRQSASSPMQIVVEQQTNVE